MFLNVICNWAGTTEALHLISETQSHVPGCEFPSVRADVSLDFQP